MPVMCWTTGSTTIVKRAEKPVSKMFSSTMGAANEFTLIFTINRRNAVKNADQSIRYCRKGKFSTVTMYGIKQLVAVRGGKMLTDLILYPFLKKTMIVTRS